MLHLHLHLRLRATALAVALFLGGGLAPAFSADARPIVRQQADASCGLAVLASLLNWAGRPTTEDHLYRRLVEMSKWDEHGRRQANEEGLSVRELIAVMHDQRMQPNARRRSPEQVWLLARREPVIVLLRFADDPAMPGHYTIVERARDDGGFDIADSALGRLRMTLDEFRSRFADPSGTGISIVPRGTHDARLLPAPATENVGDDQRRPSLQARLAQLASAQLPKGRLAFDLDVRRSVTPRVSLVTTESVQVTGRLKTDSAMLTTRYGLTDELQIGVAVPFESMHESVRFTTPEGAFEHSERSRRLADAIDLMASVRLGQSNGGDRNYSMALGGTLQRDGRLRAASVSTRVTWNPDGWPLSELSATVGVGGTATGSGRGLDWRRVGASASATIPFSNTTQAVVTLDGERDVRGHSESSVGYQVAINVSLNNRVSVAPYVQWRKSAGTAIHSLGLMVTIQARRDME